MAGDALQGGSALRVDAGEIARRLEVLDATADDRACLRALAPRLLAHADAFVTGFYAALRGFPETAVLLRSPETVARLEKAQAAYFEALLRDGIDARYVDRLLRIGAAHHRVGLKPKLYIAAFSHYLAFQIELIGRLCPLPAERARASAALIRAVFFDMSVALDAFGIRTEDEAVEQGELFSREQARSGDAAPRRAVRGRGIVIDADDMRRRRSFLGIDAEAMSLIAAHRPALEVYFERAVAAFHRLLRHGRIPRAEAMDEAQLARLESAARRYWREMLDGRLDRAYTVTRVRVGMVHEELGVSLQWYILALGLQLTTVVSQMLAEQAAPPAVAIATLRAAMFDMTYIIDAYMEARISALVEMHGFAAHVLQQMTTGLLLVDADDRVRSANWSVIRILGLAAESLKGMQLADAVPGLAPELIRIARARRADDEVTQTLHIGARRCRVRLMNVRDEAQVEQLAILIDDLTTVLDFLSASEVHESRFEEVVDELSIAVWEADAVSGMVEYITDPMERFFPQAAMRLLGRARAVDALVHEADRDRFAEAWQAVLRAGRQVELEYRLPGERRVWVRGRLTLVRRGPQQRMRVRGDMYDVTESVRLREELAERLAHQRSATTLARKAMAADGGSATIGEFVRLLAEPEQAAQAWVVSRSGGRAWLPIVASQPGRPPPALARLPLGGGEARVTELDGVPYLLAPLYDGGRSEVVAVVAGSGAGFSRSYLEFVQTLSGIVAGFVGRWIADDDALRQQRVALLGTLASSVAHDLNNVLGIIRLNADAADELLADRDDFVRELLSNVIDASERGAALTRDIVSFARSNPDREPRTRLAESVRAMRRTLRALLPSSVRLEVGSAPSMRVAVQAAHLEQLVFNLVGNASEAMGEAGRVRVSAHRARVDAPRALAVGALEPGRYGVVVVEDDGPGVLDGLASRIFDPFFTTNAARGGTGLGLCAVARIATEAHGGVEVDRSPLGGARFSVWLPELVGGPETGELGTAGPHTRPLRILLADDEPPLLRTMARLLGHAGHQVTSCPDGAVAVAYARHPFDVVITDYNMPGVNGIEVIRRFLAEGAQAGFLLISGKDVELPADLARAGVVSLLKPLSRTTLLEAAAAAAERAGG